MRQEETTNTEITLQDALDIAHYHAEGLQRLIDAANDDTLTILGWACTEHYEAMVQETLDRLDGAIGTLHYGTHDDDQEQDDEDGPSGDEIDDALDELDPDLN